jgi:hypothetical protein
MKPLLNGPDDKSGNIIVYCDGFFKYDSTYKKLAVQFSASNRQPADGDNRQIFKV